MPIRIRVVLGLVLACAGCHSNDDSPARVPDAGAIEGGAGGASGKGGTGVAGRAADGGRSARAGAGAGATPAGGSGGEAQESAAANSGGGRSASGAADGGGPAAGSGGRPAPPLGDLRRAAGAAQRFIGAAVNADALQNDDRYAELLASEFSALTPESALKWGSLEPTRGSWNFDQADRIVAAARNAGQKVKGHTFVWHNQLPGWLEGTSASELADALHEHIQTTAEHFKGQLYAWDVVNEAIDDESLQLRSGIHATLGVQGLAQAFKWAKEADPDARLFYNDYGIEEADPKTDAVLQLIRDLRAAGAPIDGVGIQAHIDTINYPTLDGLRTSLQRFAGLDLDVSYSELDVRTKTVDPDGARERRLAAQRVFYQLLGGVCVSEPACIGVTLWGFTDKYTWIEDDDPLIYDASYSRKPSYTGLLQGLGGELPEASPNRISNGDFASGDSSGWIASGGGTLSAQTTVARAGAAGLSKDRTQTYQGPGQVLPAGALESGSNLCLSAALRVDASNAQINATIKLTIDGKETFLGIGVASANNINWVELSGCRPVYFQSAPTAALLYFEGPPAGVAIYVDDVSLWTLQ